MSTYEPSSELTKAVLAGVAAPLPFGIGLAFKAIPYKERAMGAALSYVVPLSLRAIAAGYATGSRLVLTKHGELTEEVKQSLVRRIATTLVPSEVKEITAALQRDLVRMARDGFTQEAWKLEVQSQEIVLIVLSETSFKIPTETVVEVFLNSSDMLKEVSDRILRYFKPKKADGDNAPPSYPVQLYCWHFMAYPHLPADFDEKYDTGWVTVPNALWDAQKSRGLYQQYIDQLAYADELGFDGMVLNEHHQNIYGLMPSPNLIAAALSQRTKRGKIVILGNLLPLHLSPLRIAEEYAMLDNMSDGRLIAGFAPGSGPETFNYDVPSASSREQFWEAVELISRAWTEPGPFSFEGRHYPLRYVNPWPLPTQKPHPPIWIPGSRSRETLVEIAKRGYCYFLSSRSHGKETAKSQEQFAAVLEQHGDRYHPYRMGILLSAYVAETDAQAQAEAKDGVWYFLKNCLKGHLRREGRQLTFGPGIPYIPPEEFRSYLKFSDPTSPLLGDAEDWDDLQQSASIIVGSADTVTRRIMEILEQAKIGHLLIQFHLGNMPDALTRKSMRLFATEVAPRLREQSARLFGDAFPDMARQLAPELAK